MIHRHHNEQLQAGFRTIRDHEKWENEDKMSFKFWVPGTYLFLSNVFIYFLDDDDQQQQQQPLSPLQGAFFLNFNRVETRPTRLETSKFFLFYLDNDFYI
jgi:hypothetical protein